MTRTARTCLSLLAAVSVLVIFLAGVGIWIAQSDWLRERVRVEIIAQAEKATGGKVSLGAFHFDWHTLTAQVDRFLIRGTEPADQPPLLTVDRLRVELTVVSLFGRQLRIGAAEALNPRAHLIVSEQGKTNIPRPKVQQSKKNVPQIILDLKIAKFNAIDGAFLVELPAEPGKWKPWQAQGENLAAKVVYDPAHTRYSGDVNLAALHLASFNLSVSATAVMELDRILITAATLKTAGSEVQLHNTAMNHFAVPVWTGQYQAKLALNEFTKVARGELNATGTGRFASLRDYQLSGNVTGAGLALSQFRNARMTADFAADPEKIALTRARVQVIGGEIIGAAELFTFERFKAAGTLQHFDLAQTAGALHAGQSLPYDGIVSGPFEVAGTLRQQQGSAHLAITPATTGAPLRGDIALQFDSASNRIAFGPSSVDLPHSHVEVSGTPGESLQVNLNSGDAADLLPLLGTAKPDIQYGALTFNGTVSGPLNQPRFAGAATAQKVQYQQQTIDSLSADFTLSENQLSVNKSEAVLGGTGFQSRASGSLSLNNWQVSDTSAVAATVSLSAVDLTRVLALAGQKQIEATGTLSGTTQITGTLGDPRAAGDLTLTRGAIYGQPFDSISGHAQYTGTAAQTFTGLFVSGPKRVNLSGSLDRGNLAFNVTSNTMALNEINLVRARQPDIHGFGKFHADGSLKIARNARHEMQFDLNSLNADASANGLELGGRNLGEARFTTQTKGNLLEAQFDSNAAKAGIHGTGTVQLTGDYPVDAKVTFTDASLNAMAALAMKSSDAGRLNFDGVAEGELVVKGPARKPTQLTATLDLPKLELRPLPGTDYARSLPNFVVSNDGPIRMSLTSSMLKVDNARLRAPNTNLDLTGSVSIAPDAALSLHVLGNVNLALAQSFNSDLTSSGAMSVDATVRGNVENPQISGRATVRSGDFHYADFANGLTNANGEIAFNGTRATIQSLTADSGGGKVEATGFAALTNGMLAFRIETKARGVRVRYPEGVSSISDADLTMGGTSQRSDVSGTVTVHRVAINPKSDAATILALSTQPLQTASANNSLAANMNLDVQIVTAPDVALQTSVTKSIQADANLRLRGTLTNPALLGRINVTQGDLVFFGNKYSINQGTISFFNPAKIDPILDIDLETKARGVDVILTLSGPINKLNLTYRSDPPLQFSDILALLATGRTPSDPTLAVRETGQSQNFQQLGADTLLGQALANPVAGRLQRFFGVSRLKIDPQLTGITGSPQARLTVEQQVTPDILFTYITDVSSTSTQLIRAEWAFTPNWSAIVIREENGYVGLDFAYRKRFK